MKRLRHLIAFALACCIAPAALAQPWPSKPIKIVVNFPPGGAADQIARTDAPGNGSSPRLAAEMMQAQTGTFAAHVPYRGAAPALTDLLGGQIDFLFDPGIGIPHIRSGKLRLIAVASPKRSPLFPDTPTLDELGLKGFDADTVFGFYAPAGTAVAAVSRLNTEINKLIATPAVSERILAIGGVPAPMSAAEFAAKAAEDSKRFGAIIKERRIVGE